MYRYTLRCENKHHKLLNYIHQAQSKYKKNHQNTNKDNQRQSLINKYYDYQNTNKENQRQSQSIINNNHQAQS